MCAAQQAFTLTPLPPPYGPHQASMHGPSQLLQGGPRHLAVPVQGHPVVISKNVTEICTFSTFTHIRQTCFAYNFFLVHCF